MRVVMLSWEYPPRIVGGISPHVFDLSKRLVEQGIEVHVVTKATPNAPDEEVEPSGVHVHRVHLACDPNDFIHEIQLLNVATDLRCRQLLEEWRAEGKPTLFHAHDWLSLAAARELKYEYQLPIVATVHALEAGRNHGIHSDIQRYIHELEYELTYEAWRVIVCSEFMRNEVTRWFDCPADKVDVVFNGVEAEKFAFEWDEAGRKAWRNQIAREDEKIVMYVGRFVREKGIHVLLGAASIVLSQAPKTKFVVVGGGNRVQFEKFLRWNGLQDKVTFTGFMANESLQKMYRCADVAVFPSLYEPFGIVALEAMAAGVSVVTSDAGGLKEVNKHGETGLTCFAGSEQSLAWSILETLSDDKSAEKRKKHAFNRLHDEFNWELIAKQTVSIYHRVWNEFLNSHWAAETLWPLNPLAETRATSLKVAEKAVTGSQIASKVASSDKIPSVDVDTTMKELLNDDSLED